MARTSLLVWKDLIDHLVDWMGTNVSDEARRDARRASLNGVRELANESNWSYLLARGRINTVAPYLTGTLAYDHTGGTYERMVTLTSGTWPSWAAQGILATGTNNLVYEVAERKSDSVITLSVNSNPGADLDSGTTYTLYRDQFPLPSGFQAICEMIILSQTIQMSYDHPMVWLRRQRIFRGTACPRFYTILGSTDYMNTMAMGLYPAPDNAYVLDFIYKRHPRDLKIEEYSTGTVTTSASSSIITGTGTSWTSSMIGSVIRISSSRSDAPTSYEGTNPAAYERIITDVASTTSLTVDDTIAETLTTVKYLISDPVDVHIQSMKTALLRGCELQTAYSRVRKDRPMVEEEYNRAIIKAREADSRSFEETTSGNRLAWPTRLADFPKDY